MNSETAVDSAPGTASDPVHDTTTAAKSRDANATRQLLVQAARRRFARDGYSDAKVRDIAADAGVNVALINRYFDSKEGLFEACISRVGAELRTAEENDANAKDVGIDHIVDSILTQLPGPAKGPFSDQLLLLLRSSGDERADQIRGTIFETFAANIAAAAGAAPDGPDADRLQLRAQVALAAALGMALLRASMPLQPLRDASDDELRGPLRDVFTTLLPGFDA